MKYIFLIAYILFLSSCSRMEIKEKTNPAILEYFDIDTSFHYVNNKFSSCFQDTIDSYLEIRFSTKGTFSQPNRYLLLKYDGNSWKGIIGVHPTIVGDSSFESPIIPKSGWENFEDSLISMDINSLRFKDTENDSIDLIIDGESLYLEIITPNQYKIYSFHEPANLIKNCTKSKSLFKFSRIFKLVNDNFNNYYYGKLQPIK
ncbi:MAG: hypothetical protein WCK02_08055 [Bacteroidota bacterium]